MKILLDLTRAEAQELNYLITLGKALIKPSRVTSRVFAAWTEAFLKGMAE